MNQLDYLAGTIEVLTKRVERLEEALSLIAVGTVCPELFPNETNEDVLASKTAMTIALAALEVSLAANPSGKQE
jgi:hypothetical protein